MYCGAYAMLCCSRVKEFCRWCERRKKNYLRMKWPEHDKWEKCASVIWKWAYEHVKRLLLEKDMLWLVERVRQTFMKNHDLFTSEREKIFFSLERIKTIKTWLRELGSTWLKLNVFEFKCVLDSTSFSKCSNFKCA